MQYPSVMTGINDTGPNSDKVDVTNDFIRNGVIATTPIIPVKMLQAVYLIELCNKINAKNMNAIAQYIVVRSKNTTE